MTTPTNPGPWTITNGRDGFCIKDANKQVIGRAFGTSIAVNATEVLARVALPAEQNARLMAAAPELFAALVSLLEDPQCPSDSADAWAEAHRVVHQIGSEGGE